MNYHKQIFLNIFLLCGKPVLSMVPQSSCMAFLKVILLQIQKWLPEIRQTYNCCRKYKHFLDFRNFSFQKAKIWSIEAPFEFSVIVCYLRKKKIILKRRFSQNFRFFILTTENWVIFTFIKIQITKVSQTWIVLCKFPTLHKRRSCFQLFDTFMKL